MPEVCFWNDGEQNCYWEEEQQPTGGGQQCWYEEGQQFCGDIGPSAPPSQQYQPPPCAGPGDQGETCCPGLTSVYHPDQYETNEDGYNIYVGSAYNSCECPSYGCVGENQPVPSVPGGCPAPSCCVPMTNQGGVCKLPQGTITGTYTTTYMASGPGVSFNVVQTCNHNSTCDNGYQEVGTYNSLCYERKQRVAWDPPPISAAGKVCVEPNPKSKCPANIGIVASGKYTSANGGAAYGINDVGGVRLQCTYSAITNPFDQFAINAFTGPGASDLVTIQKKWCDAKNYSNMKGGPCVGFYTNNTKDYDLQQVIRIQTENPNGEWVNNSEYLSIVQQVATGSSTSGSTVVGKQTAQNMIANYCLVQKQDTWADNDTIRAIINSWAKQDAANIGDDCRLVAAGIISTFCRRKPGSSHCDCFNANQFGTNIFNACQGNTTGACTDINNLAASFAVAPAIFAPQIASLKSYITPNCAVGACVSATTSASSPYLSPSTLAAMACKSDIQLCLQSVKVGGSVAPGATINQNCSTTIGIGGTVPRDPSAPSPSNQGFQNIQAVQANANAPGGGTLAAVSSPGASSTQVTTTGTPGGGLSQTVTSNTPVGIASTGGPVSYTSPAAATPAPAPSTTVTTDNTQKYALAAGGGFLGLSFSCMCCIIIIVLAMLIFGNKPAAPRVVPLSAYGL